MGNSGGISWTCEEPGALVSDGGVIDNLCAQTQNLAHSR